MASRALSRRLSATCCSLPSLPRMRGRSRSNSVVTLDGGGLELVVEQGEGVGKKAVEIDLRELGAAGAREVEQAVDDL